MSWSRSSDADRRKADVATLAAAIRTSVLDEPMAEIPERLDGLIPMALRHGVLPMLHHALRGVLADLPEAFAADLERRRMEAVGNHMRIVADLAKVAALLDGAGVRWAVLKGPALAEAMYPRGDLRAYSDLDILVDPSSLGDVLDMLEQAGTKLLDVNWPLIRATNRGELAVVLWHGSVLDLHWHLVTEADVRRRFSLDSRDLLARQRTFEIGGAKYPMLDRCDMLTHVALHMMLSGGHRLVWFADMAAVLSVDGPLSEDDWRRIESQRCGLPVSLSLASVARRLGSGAASASLDQCDADWTWARGMRAATARRPSEHLPSHLSMQAAGRATRDTTRASVGALARAVWEESVERLPVRRRVSRRADSPENPLWIPDDSGSARQLWLREVNRF